MVDTILGLIGMIIYPLFNIVFILLDILQAVFYGLAGIGSASVNGVSIGAGNTGTEEDTGLIYYLLTSDFVKNMFMSILLLAIFLLVIFTAMTFIKNIYTDKPKKWQDIIVNAIKGIASFIFIPVVCLLGVWLSNILLNAIDGATSGSNGPTTLSGQLFVVSAYNANKLRDPDKKDADKNKIVLAIKELYTKHYEETKMQLADRTLPTNEKEKEEYYEYYAKAADDLFATGVPSIAAWWDIDDYYSLFGINYIILAGGGFFLLNSLITIAFSMVKRMFMLVVLFVISPAICAMYPMDDGKAVGSWKSEFIKQTLGAYSAVAGMNLFFALLPIFTTITIPGVWDVLGLIPLLITIAGLYMIKDVVGLINGFIGGTNALTEGEGLRKSTLGMAGKMKNKAFGAVKGATKGAFRAASSFSSVYKSKKATYSNGADGKEHKGKAFGAALTKGALASTMKSVGSGLGGLPGFKGAAANTKELLESAKSGMGQGKDDRKSKNKLEEEISSYNKATREQKAADETAFNKAKMDALKEFGVETARGNTDKANEAKDKYNKMKQEDFNTVVDPSNFISADTMKAIEIKAAKSNEYKATHEQLTAETKANKGYSKNTKAYNQSLNDYNGMTAKLNTQTIKDSSGNDVTSFVDADMDLRAKALGMSATGMQAIIKGGATFSADEISAASMNGDEAKARAMSEINQYQKDFSKIEGMFQNSMQQLPDSLKDVIGSTTDGALKQELSQFIKPLTEAIRTNDMDKLKDIMTKIEQSSKTQIEKLEKISKSSEETAKSAKKSNKAVKDVNKKENDGKGSAGGKK